LNIIKKLSYALKKIKTNDRGSRIQFRKGAWILVPAFSIAMFMPVATPVQADSFPDAGFEDGTFTGWEKGSQSGSLGSTITGNGTGVTIFTGSRTFTHSQHGAMGSPTKQDGSANPYYAPAVSAGSWTFGPNNAAKAVALQPMGQITFSNAMTALGLSGAPQTAIQERLTADGIASGNGNSNPTNAAWITREVQLTAGTTYTMSWNYLGTDYVPFNDGSVTGLVPVTVTGTPVIRVNNYVQSYALLGFTNPGTGDYSTNSYGATGWQTSTYSVDITGTYKLGFAVFNLGDTALSPVLMIDSEAGSTERCVSGTCTTFGGVASNSETAPTVPPTTTTTTASTTTSSTTTTTLPPAPTSLVVTSLDDTTSSGTLRWAIAQANANTGGIYDSITFETNGTISLASSLPSIVGTLTITGNGRTNTIIDGNNAYRPFYVGQSNSLTISNMTLKKGLNGEGGLVFNTRGTVSATNVRFTGMSSGIAVFNKEAGSVSTYTNSTFDYLNVGISADHGSTPSLLAGETTWESQQDSVFQNRTYVNNCVFDNNNSGIDSQRFVKVENSTFTNNSYAVNVQGWNRSQVIDSIFSNNGIGVYHNSWINTGTNMGTNLRLIDGNTFTNNGISIYLDDTFTNGQKNQNWATISNNSWDANGVWIRYYQWNGTTNAQGTARPYTTGTVFTQSLNTFPDTIGAPSNLTATDTGSGILLDWDAPASGGYLPERYAITWSGSLGGGGIATGNVGGATTLDTSILISYATIYSFGVAGETFPFHIRSDNDTFSKYSANSNTVSMQVGASATTTSSVPDTPPSVEVPTGTSLPETPTATIPETLLPEILEPIVIDTTIPPAPIETDLIPLPDSTVPVDEPIVLPEMPDAGEPITTDDLTDILDTTFTPDASTEEITAVLDGLLDTNLTGKQFDAVVDATLGSLDEPGADVGAVVDSFLEADLSDKEFTKVLDAVFADDVSSEVFTEALTTMLDADLSDKEFDKVLDTAFSETTSPEAMVSALSSIFDGPASGGDISKVMGAVFDEDISVADTMTVLGDLLETNLSASEAEAVFDNVFDSDLSDAETIDLIVDVLKDGLTADNLGAALGAVFDEEVSSEVLIETFTAVLGNELNAESVGVIVDVLESDTITNDQVSQVVDLITGQEGGIEAGQSAELSASPKVLESITPDQATEVFAALDVANVTPEQEAQLAEALTNAPDDIKESLEEEVDIYGDGFDDYVALGSQVDVGARRTLIAATTAVAAITAAGAATGGPGGSGGNSGGGNSNGPSGTNNNVAKKNEEEEMAGEIAGPGDDEDSNFTKNSIFKYYIKEGIEMREFNWLGFAKKLWDITAGLAFTFAGSVVVYYTLSGTTQTIALASTITACVVHYTHQIFKNDKD
jgi:hypothetical protein